MNCCCGGGGGGCTTGVVAIAVWNAEGGVDGCAGTGEIRTGVTVGIGDGICCAAEGELTGMNVGNAAGRDPTSAAIGVCTLRGDCGCCGCDCCCCCCCTIGWLCANGECGCCPMLLPPPLAARAAAPLSRSKLSSRTSEATLRGSGENMGEPSLRPGDGFNCRITADHPLLPPPPAPPAALEPADPSIINGGDPPVPAGAAIRNVYGEPDPCT
jgi:hypothetical protein